MILWVYRAVCYLSYPFILLILHRRLKKGKEDFVRFPERRGIYTHARPKGKLIWLHGASVGECLSMMPLVRYLVERPNTHVMITSGTVTSAELMAKRLPKGAFHQYIPVDFPTYTRRFIRHFHPDVAFFFESDFWPNMLMDAHKAGIPLILLNGRISNRSFARWKKLGFFIRPLLNLFTFTLGQTAEDARRLTVLGSPHTDCVGNIKFSAVPSPFDEKELIAMRNAIGGRFCWVSGSTHDDEESQSAWVHLALKKKYPNLLTICAPRHPARADDVEKMFKQNGLTVHRRSRGEDVNADVYLADTIGEMGLIYRLAPLVFVGGSLVAFGGQNMLEPMRIGACTLIGPHAFNFTEIVEKSKAQKALVEVQSKEELATALDDLFNQNEEREALTRRGQDLANSETTVLDRVVERLKEWI